MMVMFKQSTTVGVIIYQCLVNERGHKNIKDRIIHYFYNKCLGTRKENLYFDIGDKGIKNRENCLWY